MKHMAIQPLLTNTGRGMGCTEKLIDFKHGTVVRCRLCHKSVCEIPALLDLPLSTVSAVTVKGKHLGATTDQLQVKSLASKIHQSTVASLITVVVLWLRERGHKCSSVEHKQVLIQTMVQTLRDNQCLN